MKDINWKKVKQSLKHVLWIGGSPAAGRSTISTRLAADFDFEHYHGDTHVYEHIKIAEENCPVLNEARRVGGGVEYLRQLLIKKPEKIAEVFLSLGRESLTMAILDLLELPLDRPIIVDLNAGYPTWELRQLIEYDKVIFLVSTDAFRKAEQRRRFRSGSIFSKSREDIGIAEEIYLSGYVECNRILSDFTKKECAKHNLPLLITGGQMTVDETYNAVCRHFRAL